jgi:hypothetical protein
MTGSLGTKQPKQPLTPTRHRIDVLPAALRLLPAALVPMHRSSQSNIQHSTSPTPEGTQNTQIHISRSSAACSLISMLKDNTLKLESIRQAGSGVSNCTIGLDLTLPPIRNLKIQGETGKININGSLLHLEMAMKASYKILPAKYPAQLYRAKLLAVQNFTAKAREI